MDLWMSQNNTIITSANSMEISKVFTYAPLDKVSHMKNILLDKDICARVFFFHNTVERDVVILYQITSNYFQEVRIKMKTHYFL